MLSMFEPVKAILQTTPERWLNLTNALPEELLTLPPVRGEWSAVECLQHLVDAELYLFPQRIRQLLDGKDFVPFDPWKQPAHKDPKQLAIAYANYRADNLPILEQITEGDLGRVGQHPKFGPVTLREIAFAWAGHDLTHTTQAEKALSHILMPKVGPWREFFAPHEATVTA